MKFECPNCRQHIEAEDTWAGETAACPNCNRTIVIPAPAKRWVMAVWIALANFAGDAGRIISGVNRLRSGLVRAFSKTRVVDPEENERYRDASVGLWLSGLLLLALTWLGAWISDNKPALNALQTVCFDNKGWFISFTVVFTLFSCHAAYRSQIESLTYRAGTIYNVLAFAFIALFMHFLVNMSGGVFASIFGTTFMSLFAIALLVPKAWPVRASLYLCALFFNILVLRHSFEIGMPTFKCDLAVSLLSQGSFVTAASAKGASINNVYK